MLVAQHESARVLAKYGKRELTYICPECLAPVILKKGKVVSPHFSHKSNAGCAWGHGESENHMVAKYHLVEQFRARELRVEAEWPVFNEGDYLERRADVAVFTHNDEHMYAFEVQHSKLKVEKIIERTSSYQRLGIPVTWIPLVPPEFFKTKIKVGTTPVRYPPNIEDWVEWIAKYNFGSVLFCEPYSAEFWRGELLPTFHSKLQYEGRSYTQAHIVRPTDGTSVKEMKKDCALWLHGPYKFEQIEIGNRFRGRFPEVGNYIKFPEGKRATFSIIE